ncbi:hypothetical protein P8625_00715 [Tenacibaculum tangerinum]|uniref:Uncharacterized protein n=1 Tax=Tenacibaculum tangerinum TaxID=3038772 RepID=A0ABY8L2P6_9FLAO|nr:hypothetical protein [Tenacibaculum tangerinum]WGH75717.1 hypothetical protein P8625_00715 [Tenacibaculum tangerinum]
MYTSKNTPKAHKNRPVTQRKSESKQGMELEDNRRETTTQRKVNNSVSQNVVQFGGGSHYWRRQNGGPWIYSGKMGNHKTATKWHIARGYTNGKGWQFSQGGKKNPPGT